MRLFYIFLLFIACNIITVNAYLFRLTANSSLTSWNCCDGSNCNQSRTIIYDTTKNFKRRIMFHKAPKLALIPDRVTLNVNFDFTCPVDDARQVYEFYIYNVSYNKVDKKNRYKNFICRKHDTFLGNITHMYNYLNVCLIKYCESR